MTLSEIKSILKDRETISFQLPNKEFAPSHFHVTEVGRVTKDFIDCGGTIRHEELVNFQLWEADDYDHRLHPEKLLSIIELSQAKLGIGDLPIEVEYQGDTIGKFNLSFDGKSFQLLSKQTTCLAMDNCGIPEKPKLDLSSLTAKPKVCTPGGGCC